MSQLRVTSTALLCPSGGQRSLCPLSVSLQFLGHVSEAQRECAIPIQITVTMPSSLSQSLFPLISISSLPSTLADGVQHVAGRDRDILRRAIATMPITFLPISSDFDFRNSRSWATLADRVADWLIAVVADTRSPVWTWGREAFWITFVGAHPRFPDGEWPNWPCEIMLDGTFITYWMRRQQITCQVRALRDIDMWDIWLSELNEESGDIRRRISDGSSQINGRCHGLCAFDMSRRVFVQYRDADTDPMYGGNAVTHSR
ncbi:hypothetical protein NUW54_g5725 [Trametes sanguinea]|uniref:Uncharacterized protein n=1 Tax=Trametes sanguinea TaxID=158606 RepID=A0ACC1PVH7_9APHY|nr:hypothetical protein NUW54_g5725 [Trametes sanguinea]